MSKESIEIPLVKATYEELQQVICELQVERYKYRFITDKIKKYINQHCVNQKVSKEVGYKCFTMADTQELEYIYKLLEEIE